MSNFTFLGCLELVKKFVGGWWVVGGGGGGGGGGVVICEFIVLLWSKPFSSSLSFGLGPSRTIKLLSREVVPVSFSI